MNVYFIGYRGTGKSTLAKTMARQTDLHSADTDELIVKEANRSVADIFRDDGESFFRELEKKALAETSRMDRFFVSTGGGIVLDPENRKRMKETGICVYLRAEPEVIYKRTSGDPKRPPLTGSPLMEEIITVLKIREPLYRELADLTLDTGSMRIPECAEVLMKSPAIKEMLKGK